MRSEQSTQHEEFPHVALLTTVGLVAALVVIVTLFAINITLHHDDTHTPVGVQHTDIDHLRSEDVSRPNDLPGPPADFEATFAQATQGMTLNRKSIDVDIDVVRFATRRPRSSDAARKQVTPRISNCNWPLTSEFPLLPQSFIETTVPPSSDDNVPQTTNVAQLSLNDCIDICRQYCSRSYELREAVQTACTSSCPFICGEDIHSDPQHRKGWWWAIPRLYSAPPVPSASSSDSSAAPSEAASSGSKRTVDPYRKAIDDARSYLKRNPPLGTPGAQISHSDCRDLCYEHCFDVSPPQVVKDAITTVCRMSCPILCRLHESEDPQHRKGGWWMQLELDSKSSTRSTGPCEDDPRSTEAPSTLFPSLSRPESTAPSSSDSFPAAHDRREATKREDCIYACEGMCVLVARGRSGTAEFMCQPRCPNICAKNPRREDLEGLALAASYY